MRRKVSGSLWGFLLAPGENAAVGAGAESVTYAGRAEEEGAKQLGPPRLHIGIDFVMGQSRSDKLRGDINIDFE
eukprot:5025726-Pyramimonas_sp.AAC.1